MSDAMQDKIEDLARRREEAFNAGSPRAVERQHEKGKLLARERIEYLLDPGSFHELDLLARHRARRSRPRGAAVHRRRDHRLGHRRRPQGVRVLARTSPSSAARSARCSPRRSTR